LLTARRSPRRPPQGAAIDIIVDEARLPPLGTVFNAMFEMFFFPLGLPVWNLSGTPVRLMRAATA